MKNIKLLIIALFIFSNINAQKESLVFQSIDCRSSSFESMRSQIFEMVSIEIERANKFELVDKNELDYQLKKDSSYKIFEDCYSTTCLIKLAEKMKVDRVLTGSIKTLGGQTIITLKVLNVKESKFSNVSVTEFLDLPTEIRKMIQISVNNLLGIPNDTSLVTKLTKPDDFANELNSPYQIRLRSDGPRMGYTMFIGEKANRLKAPTNQGGYDVTPVMFQFGYQFEKQYLNSGNFQALFEFLPMITGLDQGKFFGSLVFMNGIRNNKTGWEIAFGPSITIAKFQYGYYDANGSWVSEDSYIKPPAGANIVKRLDSRGDAELTSSFIIAAGKTVKSGKLNIPLNVYIAPSRHSFQCGVSFGFNSKDRYDKK